MKQPEKIILPRPNLKGAMSVEECINKRRSVAVALGLASVPVGAFDDGRIKKVLNLPNGTEPLYIVPVGHAK